MSKRCRRAHSALSRPAVRAAGSLIPTPGADPARRAEASNPERATSSARGRQTASKAESAASIPGASLVARPSNVLSTSASSIASSESAAPAPQLWKYAVPAVKHVFPAPDALRSVFNGARGLSCRVSRKPAIWTV